MATLHCGPKTYIASIKSAPAVVILKPVEKPQELFQPKIVYVPVEKVKTVIEREIIEIPVEVIKEVVVYQEKLVEKTVEVIKEVIKEIKVFEDKIQTIEKLIPFIPKWIYVLQIVEMISISILLFHK